MSDQLPNTFQDNSSEPYILTWEDSYAIAKELRAHHSEILIDDVSVESIYCWTIELPSFEDDPELANESILLDIYQEWIEIEEDLSQ